MKKSFLVAAVLVILMVFSANLCAAADTNKDGDPGDDIDYVGKDMDLKEGEMGIVSVGDDIDYVGKDMDLKEGEAGIISIEEGQEKEADTKPYVVGGGTLLLVAAGGLALKLKKNQ